MSDRRGLVVVKGAVVLLAVAAGIAVSILMGRWTTCRTAERDGWQSWAGPVDE